MHTYVHMHVCMYIDGSKLLKLFYFPNKTGLILILINFCIRISRNYEDQNLFEFKVMKAAC